MTTNAPQRNVQNLVKILIGAAWLDGTVASAEHEYLRRIATEKGVADDPEIYPLLHDLRSIDSQECFRWVEQYLGDQPSREDCQDLLESISGLIYSDGTVAVEEAQLLAQIQQLEVTCDTTGYCSNNTLAVINRMYQGWVKLLDRALPT
jgi:uncharacterized tellurite resistance protein B-like protein